MARSIRSTSIVYSSGWQSTNTGFAPDWVIPNAVAINVWVQVMTSSPWPIPQARSDKCSASVPLATATQCGARQKTANSSSNNRTSSPKMKSPRSSARAIAACTSFWMLRYWAWRSTKWIFCWFMVLFSPSQMQSEIEERAQNAPPTGNGLHFRVAQRFGRVEFGDRNLLHFVAKRNHFEEEIRFQFVLVQPILFQIDPVIAEQGSAIGAKAVGRIGNAFAGNEREQERVDEASGHDAI